jgi:hypothetical protein
MGLAAEAGCRVPMTGGERADDSGWSPVLLVTLKSHKKDTESFKCGCSIFVLFNSSLGVDNQEYSEFF